MTDLTVAPQPGNNLVNFTKEQIALVARTICKPKNRDPTKDELALFLGQCKRTGLDPFAKQIYAIFRYDKRAGGEVMGIQVAIDGFRLVAERSGQYLGKASTLWCGPDEVWHEVWIGTTPPVAAKVTVRKVVAGHVAEIPAVAHWKEYASDMGLWKNMPANQLAKCAEALALRQAFPNDLSGLYTSDEMAQAVAPAARPVQQAPVSMDPVTGELLEAPARPPLDKGTLRAVQAAIDSAGVDENWLKKQLIAIGVENVDDPHRLAWLTAVQAEQLLGALSNVVDERAASEETGGD